MIYRARTSKAISAWIADRRGAWSHPKPETLDPRPEVVCPGFHLYRGFVGCPAWAAGQPCSYCFLRTTFNGQRDPELRDGVAWGGLLADCEDCHRQDDDGSCRVPECSIPIDVAPARAAVRRWLGVRHCPDCAWRDDCRSSRCEMYRPSVLNAGELADSLAFPPADNPHIAMLLDLFSDPATNPHGHKLLLLTKAGLEATQAHLSGRTPSENVICSFSLGNVCGGPLEAHWQPIEGRTDAICWALALGWRVRLRLDPLMWDAEIRQDSYYPGEHAYQVGLAFSSASSAQSADSRFPELITLGTLRHRGGRVKLPPEERAAIYRSALEGLRTGGYEGPVGLCKETPEMIREVLGIEPSEMQCNCTA